MRNVHKKRARDKQNYLRNKESKRQASRKQVLEEPGKTLLLSKGSFTTVMPYLFMTYVPATHHTQPTHTCPQCITSYRNCSLDNTQHTVLQPCHTTEQVDSHVYTTVP